MTPQGDSNGKPQQRQAGAARFSRRRPVKGSERGGGAKATCRSGREQAGGKEKEESFRPLSRTVQRRDDHHLDHRGDHFARRRVLRRRPDGVHRAGSHLLHRHHERGDRRVAGKQGGKGARSAQKHVRAARKGHPRRQRGGHLVDRGRPGRHHQARGGRLCPGGRKARRQRQSQIGRIRADGRVGAVRKGLGRRRRGQGADRRPPQHGLLGVLDHLRQSDRGRHRHGHEDGDGQDRRPARR